MNIKYSWLAGAALLLNSINTHADTVYVWSNDGTIQKFATNGVGSVVTNDLSGWNGPVGLACDNVGNLYTGGPGDSSIWRFLPDGSSSLVGQNVDSVSGLAFDNTGNLFATMPNYTVVVKLDYRQGFGYGFGYYFGISTNYSQSNLRYPVNLAFDSAGNFYVANRATKGTIEKFSTNFTDLGTFATNLNNPWGLAFDSDDNLYVANSGTDGSLNNTIVKFTTGGVRSTFATADNGLNGPQGLAFDSAGNLYVANSGNGTIEMFTPDGTGSVFAAGLDSPSSIAIFPGLKLWSATAIKLVNPMIMPGGGFQFDFIDNAGLGFTVLGTTNISLPLTGWTALGGITEVSPGQYQFTDPQATNNPLRFYRLRSP